YRGAAPVQRALIDGLDRSGVSVFRIDEGMDTGPVLRRLELPLDHADVAAALADSAHRGAEELVAAFDELAAGPAKESPQPGQARHPDKITFPAAHLDPPAPAAPATTP